MNTLKLITLILLCLSLTACSTAGKLVNPFYEEPGEVALMGNTNDHALNPTKNRTDEARQVLQQMSSYQAALPPSPNKPVFNPAVIRLMWIPDHLNSHGDLVPAHYYYLKVKKGDWAVTDAFEMRNQLETGGRSSNIPFTRN